MAGQVEKGARIDFAVWGSVIPNLGYSNIARETWLDAKLDPTVPATSNVMACVTSITAAMEAAARETGSRAYQKPHCGLFGGAFFAPTQVRERDIASPFFRISKETEYGYIRIERLQEGCLLWIVSIAARDNGCSSVRYPAET